MDRRVAGHQEHAVLVIDARQNFGEVIETDAERCTLLMPDGRTTFAKKDEIASGAMRAVPVTKIVKADGSWMYYGASDNPKNPTRTAWYHRGHVHA